MNWSPSKARITGRGWRRIGSGICWPARLKAGLTQAQLASELGIRQNMVSDYENGRRMYSDTMAKRLSTALKVKEEHIRYGREQSPPCDVATRAAHED